jgi:hypothetical protein
VRDQRRQEALIDEEALGIVSCWAAKMAICLFFG